MARNRALGWPLEESVLTTSGTVTHAEDRFFVNSAAPITITLDPHAVEGDEFWIEDLGIATAAHTINASANQLIFGPGLVSTGVGGILLQPGASVRFTFKEAGFGSVGAWLMLQPSAGGGGIGASSGGIFGDGNDGAGVMDGAATVFGIAPAGGNYTLTRDIFATNLTINSGVSLFSNGFRIFCLGTLTLLNNSTIDNSGVNAVANAPGGGGAAGSVGGGTGGGAGGAANGNGANGSATAAGIPALGTNPTGGNGGAGAVGTAGAGGTYTAVAASLGSIRSVPQAILGEFQGGGSTTLAAGGTGGGGGGGGGTGAGGGGGGGGGVIVISAANIVVVGAAKIQALGGNGGNGGAAGGGGGGGGGGGTIIVVTQVENAAPQLLVTGGNGGALNGGGSNGSAGHSGVVIQLAA